MMHAPLDLIQRLHAVFCKGPSPAVQTAAPARVDTILGRPSTALRRPVKPARPPFSPFSKKQMTCRSTLGFKFQKIHKSTYRLDSNFFVLLHKILTA
jgi:hypothetical protein